MQRIKKINIKDKYAWSIDCYIGKRTEENQENNCLASTVFLLLFKNILFLFCIYIKIDISIKYFEQKNELFVKSK